MAQVVFTKKALAQIQANNLSQSIVSDVITNGHQQPGNQPGSTFFSSHMSYGTVAVVAKHTDRGEWLVLTCWLKGSNKETHGGESLLQKILRDILHIFGVK